MTACLSTMRISTSLPQSLKFELQADRNMIHYLVKEELALMDDVKEFNYVRFMEKYDLKTTVNETMVKEEYYNLVN